MSQITTKYKSKLYISTLPLHWVLFNNAMNPLKMYLNCMQAHMNFPLSGPITIPKISNVSITKKFLRPYDLMKP